MGLIKFRIIKIIMSTNTQIYRFDIDEATRSITCWEYCDGKHDENCFESHLKYIGTDNLNDYEKSIVEDVYAYYVRCVNYIKCNWEKGYSGPLPEINIMEQKDLFIDHADNDNNSIIIKTIIRAHKLHDRILRRVVDWYNFDGCECGNYTPAFTGRCDCGNRRIKLSHKNVNWIDRFSLDSKETVSVPVAY